MIKIKNMNFIKRVISRANNTHYFISTFLLIFIVFISSCTKDTPGGGGTGGGETGGGGGTGSLRERIILDTSYGTDAKQKMDIYLPAGRNNTSKLIVMIHGGAWQAGDKNDFNYMKNLLRAKWPGAAIANINYRLASNTTNIHHTEIMNDISSAVNFMANNKTSFSISDTMAMIGESAGAHLALLYTYAFNTNNYVKAVSDMYGPAQINDWEWYNSYNIFLGQSISAVLTQYTGSPWTASTATLYESVSPMARVNAQSKPTIIFHGTVDLIVPIYQSQWLNGKLTTLAVPHEYYEYFLDGHGFNPTNQYDCATKTVLFFQQYLR
jgi:acetyl esterase/lipase